MFLFLFLLSLIPLSAPIVYTVGNATITLTNISSGYIYSSTPTINQCKKLIFKNAQLHHLSKEGAYQSWPRSNLSTPTVL